jgi:hypothetical protein
MILPRRNQTNRKAAYLKVTFALWLMRHKYGQVAVVFRWQTPYPGSASNVIRRLKADNP